MPPIKLFHKTGKNKQSLFFYKSCLLKYTYIYIIFLVFICSAALGQPHPNVMITKGGVEKITKGLKAYKILNTSFNEIKEQADIALKLPISVPTPKDGGGGYTHEQHKRNYSNVLNCGIAYQILKDKRYANYIKEMLLNYASKYQSWGLHPARKNDQQSGRIFWQSLNDFVWQTNMIQGYDLVYDAIGINDRKAIETQLFEPVVKFITEDCYETFNKIHNHGTWALAAVGLTGYILNKPQYVEMALNGSKGDKKSGYWAQLNQLFSPDGYYEEGPYYQRYALFPFLVFAKAIHNYQPQLNVFSYRDKILAKAVATSLQSTYTNGAFFPLNDAIKDKTLETNELVYGVNIIYANANKDAGLLDIAQKQNRVTVSDDGFVVAKAVNDGLSAPFRYISEWIRDGADGTKGGIGILRSGSNNDQQCVVIKAGSQGMGHGHFDRLNLLYYDNGGEVFLDYGAARFLNIETKRGGHYLPENDTWAKQTIAHNTLVVDRSSHFNGNLNEAEKYHPELIFFSSKPDLKVVSVREKNAYSDVILNRTTALITVPGITKPLLLDVFKAITKGEHQYDLPFWYKGQLVDASYKIQANTDWLKPMGKNSGFQHIWLNAEEQLSEKNGYIKILNNKRFYTTHFASEAPLKVSLVTTGANDPEMNLVTEKGFVLSRKDTGAVTFVSITETHGNINAIEETVTTATPSISQLRFKNVGNDQTVISFKVQGNVLYTITIDYNDAVNFIRFNR